MALLLLQTQSIYSQTNKPVLQQLRRDSEFLQAQLSQYASISGNFDTKSFYEVYHQIPRGKQGIASVDVSFWNISPYVFVSACLKVFCCHSGDSQAETVAINKDHIGMAKFTSSEDEDFKTICGHLGSMVSNAPQKIAENCELHKRQEGA